jgi:hypothetical protein
VLYGILNSQLPSQKSCFLDGPCSLFPQLYNHTNFYCLSFTTIIRSVPTCGNNKKLVHSYAFAKPCLPTNASSIQSIPTTPTNIYSLQFRCYTILSIPPILLIHPNSTYTTYLIPHNPKSKFHAI